MDQMWRLHRFRSLQISRLARLLDWLENSIICIFLAWYLCCPPTCFNTQKWINNKKKKILRVAARRKSWYKTRPSMLIFKNAAWFFHFLWHLYFITARNLAIFRLTFYAGFMFLRTAASSSGVPPSFPFSPCHKLPHSSSCRFLSHCFPALWGCSPPLC